MRYPKMTVAGSRLLTFPAFVLLALGLTCCSTPVEQTEPASQAIEAATPLCEPVGRGELSDEDWNAIQYAPDFMRSENVVCDSLPRDRVARLNSRTLELADAGDFPNLEGLVCHSKSLSLMIQAISGSPSLKWIHIEHSTLTLEVLQAIADCPNLKCLSLFDCSLPEDLSAVDFSSTRTLAALSTAKVSLRDVAKLAQKCENLAYVSLGGLYEISEADVFEIARVPHIKLIVYDWKQVWDDNGPSLVELINRHLPFDHPAFFVTS